MTLRISLSKLHQNDYFITGNHDDCSVANGSPNYLGKFGFRKFGDKTIFFLSGAMSTDREWRTEGHNWWAHEELNYLELTEAIKLYDENRPDLMITHDCPTQIREKVFGYRDGGRTAAALSNMFEIHQPLVWAFGHHHRHVDMMHEGTRFMCLAELQNKKVKFEVIEED